MDPATQKRKRRARRLVRLLIGAIIVLPIGGVLYATFGPNPPIVISKATTHLTAPLDADGLPDYATALLADMKKGVTPENNGAVLFMKAMWPAEDDPYCPIAPEDGRLLCQELGLAAPPDPSRRIGPFDTPENRLGVVRLLRHLLPPAQPGEPTGFGTLGFYNMLDIDDTPKEFDSFSANFNKNGISTVDAEALQDERVAHVLYGCQPVMRPWTSNDLPFLAGWLEDRREAFDMLVRGAEKSRWYLPAACCVRSERGHLSGDTVSVQLMREAMWLLQSRSLLHVGEGRDDEALRDGLAIVRLGNHLSTGAILTHRFVGDRIAVVGYFNLFTLIDSGQASIEELRRALAELRPLKPLRTIRPEVIQTERFLVLDRALWVKANGIEAPEVIEEPFPGAEFVGTPTGSLHYLVTDYSIDWNITLREINQHFDRLEALVQMPAVSTRDQVESAFASIDAEILARQTAFQRKKDDYSTYPSRDRRSELLANAFLAESVPYRYHQANDDRHAVHRDLCLIHLALAISRSETGEYPESLDELVPDILPTLPSDPFNAKPYAYRRTDDGFLLYSLGPDGIDHGGSCGDFSDIPRLEGIEVEASQDPVTGALSPYDPADQELLDKIPAGADDVSLRVPLPIEPWPWEE